MIADRFGLPGRVPESSALLFLILGGKLSRPPAFQFYPRDWLTSPTVAQMSRGDRADYLHLLCHAWISEEPGTLPLPVEVSARIVGWKASKLRSFLERFPTQFQRNPDHICNQKLRNQYLENKKYVESKSIAGKKGNEVRWHSDRSASASASASASETLKTPPARAALDSTKKDRKPSEGFLLFLECYPQDHLGVKSRVQFAWMEIPSSDMHMGEIIDGLEKWKGSERWSEDGGRYIPNAENFLKAKLWRHSPPQPKSLEENNREVLDRAAKRWTAKLEHNSQPKTN